VEKGARKVGTNLKLKWRFLLNDVLSKISMQTAEQETAGSRTIKESENSRTEIATPLISDEDKTKKTCPLLAPDKLSELQLGAKRLQCTAKWEMPGYCADS